MQVGDQSSYRRDRCNPWLRNGAWVGARSSPTGSRLPSSHSTRPGPAPVSMTPASVYRQARSSVARSPHDIPTPAVSLQVNAVRRGPSFCETLVTFLDGTCRLYEELQVRPPLSVLIALLGVKGSGLLIPAREFGDSACYGKVFNQNRIVLPPVQLVDLKADVRPLLRISVPLRDRCSFGRFQWLISQALSVTYMAGERRLYLERNCRLPESPAHSRQRNREGPASSKGLNSQRGFGPAVEPRRKSRPRSTSLHGSSPCKCQRLSTLRWDRLPPSRPSTKSGARAGGRRLSDRRLHRWLAGTSASAPSSHGAADLLGLNRAHICVRNPNIFGRVVASCW